MIKINKKLIISIALVIIISFILVNNVFATVDPSEYEPNPEIRGRKFIAKSKAVLGWIQYLGIIISILALAIIGVKYMFSSVEGKAEYKKTMIPYIVGCFMLMGISVVIALIENVIIG